MVMLKGKNPNGIDFSILPTLECNLKCSFCMYDCSSDNKEQIDLEKLEDFLLTIPAGVINAYGLYGGEPSINIPLYKRVVALLPVDAVLFTITNGSWTRHTWQWVDFVHFVVNYSITCFISSTPEHTPFQDTYVLKNILRAYNCFAIKEDDTLKPMLSMGRYSGHEDDPYCTVKCVRLNGPERLAVMPNGDIIYQTCDGKFPVVGTIDEPFDLNKYSKRVQKCQLERL